MRISVFFCQAKLELGSSVSYSHTPLLSLDLPSSEIFGKSLKILQHLVIYFEILAIGVATDVGRQIYVQDEKIIKRI